MPASLRSLPPPTKKRKLQDDAGLATSIKHLEDGLTQALSNNTSLNALADLVDLALTAKDPQNTSKVVYALYRVFVLIINDGRLGLGVDDAGKVVKAWLWQRLNTYVEFLGGLMQDEEKALRISALQILLSLQKHLSSSYSKTPSSSTPQPQFHMSHFRKIVAYLLLCPPSTRPAQQKVSDGVIDPDVLLQFYETWFSVYDDIRWFFLRDAATLLNRPAAESHQHLPSNLLSVLELLTTFPTEESELNAWWVPELGSKPPKPKRVKKKAALGSSEDEDEGLDEEKGDGDDDDDWRKFFDEESSEANGNKTASQPRARLHTLTIHQSLHSLPSHRAVFTRAWLTLLPQLNVQDDAAASKAFALRALNVMHRGVMPHLTRAILVMDWVGSCIDYGSTVGLLAFNALFILIRDYNLDYPSFYTRLYAFLDREVLHLKHRARFFRMIELFLGSSHLPAAILASFVKRLSRLSLSAPPAAIVMIIPFTYNILKRHPALMVMIHRAEGEDDVYTDPFLPQEPNPLLTQALSSSLWELYSQSSHYHSSVSTLAKILSEAFTKPGYAMEDFLDHTYHTLFNTEVNRKIKKEPALAMEIDKPVLIFPTKTKKDDEEGKVEDEGDEVVQSSPDVVSDLWTF
ncbi:CBF/Mak21 family domain containing protein [Amanita muscaria]